MRRLILSAALIVLALITAFACGGFGLALAKPLLPGYPFFRVQYAAEQGLLNFIENPAGRAVYLMNLAEKRTSDFTLLVGTKHASTALAYLDLSIDQVSQAIPSASSSDYDLLHLRFTELIQQVDSALATNRVGKDENAELYDKLRAKILALKMLNGRAKSASGSSQLPQLEENQVTLPMVTNKGGPSSQDSIDPRVVQFPPGSPGALHAFFPLTGKHASLGCAGCHLNGNYAGTPEQCEACHSLDKPGEHFSGDCASCHVTDDWSLIHFDHSLAGTNDCESCHASGRPADHYSGQCSLCHNTTNWSQAIFNHQAVDATDCESCHEKEKPANHFDGECSACHDTTNWSQVTFNHRAVEATDCESCHIKERPENHFDGQCSACHDTSGWKGAVFNHEQMGATDCQSCHSKEKPVNHFDGQCSACHNTNQWQDASFDHESAGATDCQSCHSKDKPSNHFDGQCSSCHSTSSWKGASFNHQTAGATDCQSCHSQDKPANHFDGQCSDCHNTSNWADASFSHSFPMDHGGANGDCAKCHPKTTEKWTCYTCHDKAKTEAKHSEEGILDIAGRCLDCHPGGKEDD